MKLDLRGNDWPVDELEPDAIEKISWQIRSEYIDLISRLGQDRKRDLDWWVTSLASRNTYACSLYLRLCQLALVKNLYDKGRMPSEIVTDSTALASIFRRTFGGSIKVTLVAEKNVLTISLGFCRRYAAAFYHATCQYLCSTLWLKKAKLPDAGAVLVDIFIGASSITASGIEDRYYPGMIEALDEQDRKQLIYTPIHYKVKNYPAYFKKLNQCHDQLLLKEDVLTITDYFYALMHPFRFRWPDKSIEFMGLDVGAVVREALSETFSNSSSIEGLLRYRFARRLKILGFKPGKIIEWFENQEVDHGAIAGWREFFPELEVVGYQGFFSSPHYLSSLPIIQEQEYSLLPTKVVVMGENLIDSAREFAPNLNVVTGPAFRFSSVWNEIEINRNEQEFNLLVALSILFQESNNIIDMLEGAVAENRNSNSINILIKPHPTWTATDVKRLLLGKEFQYELLDSTFDDALAIADLVVSAASSVCAYAIARAVPCVVIGVPGSLLQNSIPRDADRQLWKACYSATELAGAIGHYSALEADEKDELIAAAKAYRRGQFEPVSKGSIYEFIGSAD